jgi:hypothetical protein
MDFPQSTLEEITESERQMVLTAKERFGNHYVNARAGSVFRPLPCSVEEAPTCLRSFSAVRLHKVQAMMNLRQVLEAGAAAADAEIALAWTDLI